MNEPRVGSETGTLRKALVHAPGAELAYVSPSNQHLFGFNDLLYERYTRREHDTLVSLLCDVFGVEVLYFRDLLFQALSNANAMDHLRLLQTVSQIEDLSERDQERLLALATTTGEEDVAALVDRLIAGEPVRPDTSLSEFLNPALYHLAPIPNLMLVRDLCAVIDSSIFVAWNSVSVRRRENLLWRFALQQSSLRESVHWSNWMVDDVQMPGDPRYSLDGGNVVQPAEHVVVVGQSERTGTAAVEKLTQWLVDHVTRETHLFIARLPAPIEHLDTIFTMLSRDECLIFPPSVFGNGPESINLLHAIIRPGEETVCSRPAELLPPLSEALGIELQPISCGGANPPDQRREQWWGGACLLAVAPGKLIAFRSAQRTIAELEARGYVCLDSDEVLAGKQNPHVHEKCVVLIRGSELSRARGGPRSYVLPLVRDPL